MDRESYFFPPDAEDFDRPTGLINSAREDLKKAAAALQKVLKHVSDFRELGSGKEQLIRNMLLALRKMSQEDTHLELLLGEIHQMQDAVIGAFHDPLNSRNQPNYVYAKDEEALSWKV